LHNGAKDTIAITSHILQFEPRRIIHRRGVIVILLDKIPWSKATARLLAELKTAPTTVTRCRRGTFLLLLMLLLIMMVWLKAPAANLAGNQQQRPKDEPPAPHRNERDGALDFSFFPIQSARLVSCMTQWRVRPKSLEVFTTLLPTAGLFSFSLLGTRRFAMARSSGKDRRAKTVVQRRRPSRRGRDHSKRYIVVAVYVAFIVLTLHAMIMMFSWVFFHVYFLLARVVKQQSKVIRL
jgi:hypothetical protein